MIAADIVILASLTNGTGGLSLRLNCSIHSQSLIVRVIIPVHTYKKRKNHHPFFHYREQICIHQKPFDMAMAVEEQLTDLWRFLSRFKLVEFPFPYMCTAWVSTFISLSVLLSSNQVCYKPKCRPPAGFLEFWFCCRVIPCGISVCSREAASLLSRDSSSIWSAVCDHTLRGGLDTL